MFLACGSESAAEVALFSSYFDFFSWKIIHIGYSLRTEVNVGDDAIIGLTNALGEAFEISHQIICLV